MSALSRALSVVVPTYNEADNMPALLQALMTTLEGTFQYEVIIADDRSPDGTEQLARAVAAELGVPLRVVSRHGARSLALSVMEGARAARNDCVVVLDADLSHDVGDIVGLAEEVLTGRADVAVASRYARGGRTGEWPLARRLLSSFGTRLARAITRVEDPLSGFFACRRELLSGAVPLRPRGYKILLELLGRAPGLRVSERPTVFRDRERGTSKLTLRQKLEFLRQLLGLLAVRFQRRVPIGSETQGGTVP